MSFGHDPALLVGVEECGHSRHVERGLDAIFGQPVEDPWHPDPVAELAPGQAADRLAAVPQITGLVVAIERQRNRAACAAWPLCRSQPPPGEDAVDELAPLFLGPLPGFEVGLRSAHAFVLLVHASIDDKPAGTVRRMVGAV